ncbi:helix-turn-helix domain-containing protein [Tsuneonella sp. HG249]
MDKNTGSLDDQLPLHSVGERLRVAREQAGMTLEQLAAETRIPQRHLVIMEASNWNALPARTYATGFARTYAKAVGLEPKGIVEDVSEELAASDPAERYRGARFEPGDPARVPSRGLALMSLLAVALLLVGGIMFYNRMLSPGSGPGSLLDQERLARQAVSSPKAAVSKAGPTAPTGGPVVFTSLEDGVWVKFYDGTGAQLMQKQMAKGETYTVPTDASGPQVWTGRPDALAITVGGRTVPKLAESESVMKDVPVTAEALLRRAVSGATRATPAMAEGT